MVSRRRVEFVTEMALFKQGGKPAVCGEKTFLFAAGKVEVGDFRRIGGPCKDKGVIVMPCLAAPRAKDGAMVPPLRGPLDGKGSAWNVQRGTDSSCESESLRVAQRQVDGAKSSHGYARNCAARLTESCGEFAFNVGDQIIYDVIFVAVL